MSDTWNDVPNLARVDRESAVTVQHKLNVTIASPCSPYLPLSESPSTIFEDSGNTSLLADSPRGRIAGVYLDSEPSEFATYSEWQQNPVLQCVIPPFTAYIT